MSTKRVKELTDKLEEGLKNLKDSDEFKKYLKCMSRFHSYSYNNTLLIMMQMPQATLIAGYGSWKKNFNRTVKKGEKGIKILAPVPVKRTVDMQSMDENGETYTQKQEITIPVFRPVTVFDISQTEGEPVAELNNGELKGSVKGYEDLKRALFMASDVPVIMKDIEDGAKGYFDPKSKDIYIKKDMSESQTIKTMIHEMAHSILHNSADVHEKKDRNTKEVEAESVAFTVCSHFGIDTGDYSFAYILGWSRNASLDEFKRSLETIQKCSSRLIKDIQANLKEIKIERKSIRQRLSESKDKSMSDRIKKTKEKTNEFSHIQC